MDKDPLDSDRFKNVPPEILARLKKQREEGRAQIAANREKFAREFKIRDSVQGMQRTPRGHLDPSSGVTNLRQWSDDYGNTVYTQTITMINGPAL